MRNSKTLVRLAVALVLLAGIFQIQVPAAQSAECVEGSFRTVTVGPMCGCDDGQTTPKERHQCIDGQWEYLYSFCGGPFCQGS